MSDGRISREYANAIPNEDLQETASSPTEGQPQTFVGDLKSQPAEKMSANVKVKRMGRHTL